MIIQRKQIKENPYDFNPIEEKITAAFDWVTGNKNSISVSDDMKDMKYLSERIARTLLRQMGKNGENQMIFVIWQKILQISKVVK